MASSTPTKSKTTSKSNIAKSKLTTKSLFNLKTASALAVALVVLLGFVYILFSQAGSQKEYVYYAGYTTANGKNSVEVWDPTAANQLVKSIDLPAYPSQTGCTTNRPYWYDRVVELRSANLAFVLPSGCGNSSNNTESLLIPSVNTASHTYTGKALSYSGGQNLDAIANESKKHIYLYDTNKSKITVIDGPTNTAIKTINTTFEAGIDVTDVVVSGDGLSLIVLYGSDGRGSYSNPATYKNVVIYDTSTFAEKGRFKANESGFAFKNRSHSHGAASITGSNIVYAISRVANSNSATTKLQLTTLNTANLTATSIDLPTTNLQFDDIASIQQNYLYIMTMKGYDPATQKSLPLLLKYNLTSKQFESAPGANIDTTQSGVMFSSQNPQVGIITTYNTLSTYNFSTGVVANYVPRQGTPILGGAINTATPTPSPTPTATPTATQAPGTSAPTSTGTWTADKLLLVKGTLTTKADGAKQITSVKEGNWSVSHFSLDNVAPDTYCVSGTAPAGSYSQIIARYDELGRTVADPAQLSPLAAGAFETCASLAARPADQPSAPSHVFVQIYSPAVTPTTVDKMYIQSASTNPAPASSS